MATSALCVTVEDSPTDVTSSGRSSSDVTSDGSTSSFSRETSTDSETLGFRALVRIF